MEDNYHDTVYRMYESSDVLLKKGQWFNANYLAGYVLECYCKLILSIANEQGHVFSGNRTKAKDFGHGVSNLKDEVELIRLGECTISGYCLDVQDVCPNILSKWNPNKRYEADSSVLNKDFVADAIHTEVEVLMDEIIRMEIDGVLV